MQQYFSSKRKNEKLYLDINDHNHIKNVMRMKENDFVVVVYEKEAYKCKLNSDLKSVEIIEKFLVAKDNFQIHLYIPILKEDKIDLILEKATELGVTEITPVEMKHCKFKVNKEKKEKKIVRWQKIVKEASEQCHRNVIPKVNNIVVIEDIKLSDVNILCSTDKENVKSVKEVLNNIKTSDIINVVFGPEGGFEANEEAYLIEKGFTKTTLGSRILRTETVPIYVLSILNYNFME